MPTENPLVLHTRVVCGTGGGPEKTILHSARPLIAAGYDVLCAYMHPPGDPGFDEIRRRAQSAAAPLEGIEDRGPWDLRVPRRLSALCKQRRVAVWHGHDYKSNVLGLWVRRRWPMKLVTTVHGWVSYTPRSRIYYVLDRLALRWYEKVICVSDDLRTRCIASGVDEARCVVIDNAIDGALWKRSLTTRQARLRLGLAPDRLLVGSVGRLTAEKNYEAVVRVLGRLARAGLDVDLVLVGEGDRREAIEAQAAELGLGERVRLLGYRSDTLDVYQALDVFVLGSLREGLPNVLLEAMALEVPVVATRVAGVPRLIEHGISGLLVDPGAEEELTVELGRLLNDHALRAHLAAAGRRAVQTRFSFDTRMDHVRAIYDELLGRA